MFDTIALHVDVVVDRLLAYSTAIDKTRQYSYGIATCTRCRSRSVAVCDVNSPPTTSVGDYESSVNGSCLPITYIPLADYRLTLHSTRKSQRFHISVRLIMPLSRLAGCRSQLHPVPHFLGRWRWNPARRSARVTGPVGRLVTSLLKL